MGKDLGVESEFPLTRHITVGRPSAGNTALKLACTLLCFTQKQMPLLLKGPDLLELLIHITLNAQGLAEPEAGVQHMAEGRWMGDTADDCRGEVSLSLSSLFLLLTSNLPLGEDNSASLAALALYHK